MNKREEERLNALLAKKEAEEKADKEFFKQVKKRRDEVLKVLKVEEAAASISVPAPDPKPSEIELKVKDLAQKYGCTEMELLNFLGTDSQINFFKKYGRS